MIRKKFAPPNLPVLISAGVLDQERSVVRLMEYQNNFSNVLDIYFRSLEAFFNGVLLDALNGGALGNAIAFPYVGAYDSTDQYGTTDTPIPVKFGSSLGGLLFGFSAPGVFTAQTKGIFCISYELQVANNDAAEHFLTTWVRVNGVDVSNSSMVVSIPSAVFLGNLAFVRVAHVVLVELLHEDEVEVFWATDKAADIDGIYGVYLYHDETQVSPYIRPAISSASIGIKYVSSAT